MILRVFIEAKLREAKPFGSRSLRFSIVVSCFWK